MRQVELNVHSLIDLCVDTMSNQMKGIRSGKQDVHHLLLNMWKGLLKWNDEKWYNEQMCSMLILCQWACFSKLM
jgi:hypothetical protein